MTCSWLHTLNEELNWGDPFIRLWIRRICFKNIVVFSGHSYELLPCIIIVKNYENEWQNDYRLKDNYVFKQIKGSIFLKITLIKRHEMFCGWFDKILSQSYECTASSTSGWTKLLIHPHHKVQWNSMGSNNNNKYSKHLHSRLSNPN
jgi:hypothetical protein